MWADILTTVEGFKTVFSKGERAPLKALLPLVAMALAWPGLTVALQSERQAFMMAFVLAVAIRLATRADETVQSLRFTLGNRLALLLALLLGPAVFAALVLKGEPLWCQRFLSAYFLVMAALYLLDVIAGGHAMTRRFVPGDRPAEADPLMARVMAVFYLGLVLWNEAMMQQSAAVWLIWFGFLPLMTNRVTQALGRTVEMAWAKGYGRF